MKRFLLMSLFIATGTLSVFAQNKVEGKVINSIDNQPIVGATVSVKGTSIGTATDKLGNFSIQYTSGSASLIISNIGYETQEIPIDGRKEISVQLLPSIKGLSEVVVTVGYRTQLKKDLTGSVAVVGHGEFKITTKWGISHPIAGASFRSNRYK